jgi:hypothetical protein
MTNSLNPVLNGYRMLWNLGTGPSGRTVAGLHKATGRRVVLKIVDRSPATGPDFHDQAHLWQDLDSPRVVHLYGYVESGGTLVTVLELMAGPSLGQVLERDGTIPPTAALAALDDILIGLAAAHEVGLGHGNLKPENVLLDRDGHGRITDFAAFSGPPRSDDNAVAADLHTAIAVFVRSLTGIVTKPDGTVASADVATSAAQVPEAVRSLIQHGLARNPSKRPSSATEFQAELHVAAITAYGPNWKDDGTAMLEATARALPAGQSPRFGILTIKGHRFQAVGAAVLVLLTALLLLHLLSPTASTAASTSLPVLYGLGADGEWSSPEIRPATFFVFEDGSAAVTGMRWASWTDSTAVTGSAIYNVRTGPCCDISDQYQYRVTVTLSEFRQHGGNRPGPYFSRLTITGPGLRTLTYTYTLSDLSWS